MRRALVALTLAALALSPAGCCSIARLACDIEPPPPPPKGGRETPEAAVDFLIEAFRDRQKLLLYESFSAEFRRANGDFSASEFGVAYDKAESEFKADASNLAAATRTWRPRRDPGVAVVDLENRATGAFFPIAFVNHPKVRIAFDDPFVPPIAAPASRGLVLRMADGRVTVDLTKIEGVQPETLAGLTEKNIQRLEFADDWQVLSIDTDSARGIRFLDKIKEYAGK